ncbi:MAG: hypothetical protein KIT73_01275 [Burkholderiales bacterium]|nr:hypothetical protein [Burkholderiales bacterium]
MSHIQDQVLGGTSVPQHGTAGAGHVLPVGLGAGERRTNDPSTSYRVVSPNARRTVISNGAASAKAVAPAGVAIRVLTVHVTKALTGTVTLAGSKDETGTDMSIVLPGGYVGAFGLGSAAEYPSGMSVTKSSASDDGLVIVDWDLL